MKLTICIPVYNFDVNNLINDLTTQINAEHLDVDIIVIDDGSEKKFIDINKSSEPTVNQYILLANNIGRSKIRNLFLKYSQAEYFLFLDCDGKVIRQDFIKKYLNLIERTNPDVIYGGRTVSEIPPDSEYGLRWKFAIERENLPVKERLKSPYLDFQTNNFVVRRSILEKVPFNEDITQYGYEDLIFSHDLQNHKVEIDHIDNPIFNNDVESNTIFLSKADQSAKSLAQLIKTENGISRVSQVRLAKAYLLMKKTRTIFIYRFIYKLIRSQIKKMLLTGDAPLKALDFYKLGQLIGYMKAH